MKFQWRSQSFNRSPFFNSDTTTANDVKIFGEQYLQYVCHVGEHEALGALQFGLDSLPLFDRMGLDLFEIALYLSLYAQHLPVHVLQFVFQRLYVVY